MKKFLEERAKAIEVIAIVLGGIFAFITWGVDQLSIRQPNWDVMVDNVSEVILAYQGNIGCSWEGTVKIENRGTRPLSALDTKIEFYRFPRPEINGVAEYSGYHFESQVCANEGELNCVAPFHTTEIAPLDNSLIFPQKSAWRPFSIIFGQYNTEYDIQQDLESQIMLVRITQMLQVESQYGW